MATTTTEVATLNLVTPQPSIVLSIGNREVVRINHDGTVSVNAHGGVYPVDKISKEFLNALASSRVPMPNELGAANERIARLRKALIEVINATGGCIFNRNKAVDSSLCEAPSKVRVITAELSAARRELDAARAEVERLQALEEASTRQINEHALEHDAFESWAIAQGYDTCQHPLHYLFLDQRTYHARHGWKAALAALPALEEAATESAATETMTREINDAWQSK